MNDEQLQLQVLEDNDRIVIIPRDASYIWDFASLFYGFGIHSVTSATNLAVIIPHQNTSERRVFDLMRENLGEKLEELRKCREAKELPGQLNRDLPFLRS